MFLRKPVFALGIETASFYAGVHNKRYSGQPGQPRRIRPNKNSTYFHKSDFGIIFW